MNAPPAIVWFRHDLRLDDNPALLAAARHDGPVIPLFIWSPEEEAPWQPGAASRWWLHQSLQSLAAQLEERGSRLILRQGPAARVLQELIDDTDAVAVFWNRRYEPAVVQRDRSVSQQLQDSGLTAESFSSHLLWEPWTISTKQDQPYRVFTPFWKACLAAESPPPPEDAPEELPAPGRWPASASLDELGLLPQIDWAAGLRETWTPGEPAASRALFSFLQQRATQYDSARDCPAEAGTSRLSPHLHFGEISVRRIWQTAGGAEPGSSPASAGVEVFLKELGWREFAHHVLYHFPHTASEPLQEKFAGFPWRSDSEELRAWQRGETGFELVDAGMRELWHTGWMHNRVRMVTASFLTKDLLIDWREGARWFWDTLVDADLASNTLGWQWAGGCGADAAPFFRIFNPHTQAEKFDPDHTYISHWGPELPGSTSALKRPSTSDCLEPIVDHRLARQRALETFRQLSGD